MRCTFQYNVSSAYSALMNILYILIMVLPGVLSQVVVFAQGPSDLNNWTLVWSDEFNDATINTSMWKVEPEFDHWGAHPDIVAIDDNVFETGGNLVLRHKVENYSCTPPHGQTGDTYYCVGQAASGQPYSRTGGYIWSKSPYNFTYGYIESRMKLDYAFGLFPAFWTIIGDGITGNQSACEIDIFEMTTATLNSSYMTGNIHYSYPHPNVDPTDGYFEKNIGNWDDVYRVWGLEWNPDEIIWYVDGEEIRRYSGHNIHEPVKILIDLMLQANYISNPAVSPVDMLVDYVRVYQLIQDCDNDVTTCNLNVDGLKSSITFSNNCGIILPSGKTKFRATNYYLINGDFTVPLGSELVLYPESCY